jgi:hypothetical protein
MRTRRRACKEEQEGLGGIWRRQQQEDQDKEEDEAEKQHQQTDL